MTRTRLPVIVAALAVLFLVATVVVYGVVRHYTAPTAQTLRVVTAPPSAVPPPPAEPLLPANPGAGDDGSPAAGDDPASKAEQASWEPVAVAFGKAFTTGTDNPTAWRARLARYSTTAVQSQLAGVDPTRIPAGRYDDHDVLQYDETTAAVVINYDRDWAIAVRVISDGSTWKVYEYDRWQA